MRRPLAMALQGRGSTRPLCIARTLSSAAAAASDVKTSPYEVPLKKVGVGTPWERELKLLQGPKEVEPVPWTPEERRCGAMAMKVGMLPLWDEWGERHACTVLQLDACEVIQVKTEDTDGYNGIQVGVGEAKLKNVIKPLMGHYNKAMVIPKRKLKEFRVSEKGLLPVGSPILAQHFVPGQLVDLQGVTKGKGFQGAMKRWGFGGLGASHGVSKAHRSLGSTGQCQDPGRVFKGKKMPGRMGGNNRTVENLKILKIEPKRNLLYVKGCVPGQNGGWIRVKDAERGAHFPTPPPFPTFVPEEGVEYPNEIWAPAPKEDPMAPKEVFEA